MKWRQRTTTDDNWRLLQFLNQFTTQVTTLHRTTWRPDDIVTAQVTTHEDLLTTQVTAREDLLTTKLKALDDILTTVHDDTDDLLDDTDNLYIWYKNIIPYGTYHTHVCILFLLLHACFAAVSRDSQRTEPLCFFLCVLPITATDQTRAPSSLLAFQ
jgi:hypothetical protein